MSEKLESNQKEQRMQLFAKFFKGYMGTAPMIAAALPIPVTASGAIPTWAEQTGFLTTYTSMFCFLIVSLVFYRRHRLAGYLTPEHWEKKTRLIGRFIIAWLPFVLIFLCLISILTYHYVLDFSISSAVHKDVRNTKNRLELLSQEDALIAEIDLVKDTLIKKIAEEKRLESAKMSLVLKEVSLQKVRTEEQVFLILSFMGIFITSTLAFALMAVREYMQNELNLSEVDLIHGARDPFANKKN